MTRNKPLRSDFQTNFDFWISNNECNERLERQIFMSYDFPERTWPLAASTTHNILRKRGVVFFGSIIHRRHVFNFRFSRKVIACTGSNNNISSWIITFAIEQWMISLAREFMFWPEYARRLSLDLVLFRYLSLSPTGIILYQWRFFCASLLVRAYVLRNDVKILRAALCCWWW